MSGSTERSMRKQARARGCRLAFAVAAGWAIAAATFAGPPATGPAPQPASRPSGTEAVVAANNEFAFDLFARARRQDGNVMAAPQAAWLALFCDSALLPEGGRLTFRADVLHLRGVDEAATLAAVAYLQRQLQELEAPEAERAYRSAAAIWTRPGQVADGEAALGPLRQELGAAVEAMSPTAAAAETAAKINTWVEGITRGRIKQLLTPADVEAAPAAWAISAMYFKDAWYHPFYRGKTTPADFHAPGVVVKVAMMRQEEERYDYWSGEGVSLISLPYRRYVLNQPRAAHFSMLLILPDEKTSLDDLERRLTAARFRQWSANMKEAERAWRDKAPPWVKDRSLPLPADADARFDAWLKQSPRALVDLQVPRFSSRSRLTLGVGAGAGNRWGLSEGAELAPVRLVQEAFIKLDEEGTEAAGGGAGKLFGTLPGRPVVFHADRPFLFVLREEETGMILLIGRVAMPETVP